MNPVISSGTAQAGGVTPATQPRDGGRAARGAARFSIRPRAPETGSAERVPGGEAGGRLAARMAAEAPRGTTQGIPDAIAGYRFNAPAIAVKMLEPAKRQTP